MSTYKYVNIKIYSYTHIDLFKFKFINPLLRLITYSFNMFGWFATSYNIFPSLLIGIDFTIYATKSDDT